MDASILIPTRGRSDKLCRCLAALARQTGDAVFEVIVGFDGPDAQAEGAARHAWSHAGASPSSLRCIQYSQRGLINVRNAMIAEAEGAVLVSINDDITPSPGFVAAHLDSQREQAQRGRPAIIVGHSPYAIPEKDSLLNRLVRETPMVFFYDVMNTPEALRDRARDWGFRHCFGLNFSAPMEQVRAVGGFRRVECPYGYEDIELAFRLKAVFNTPVLYRPEARAEHDHRYEPEDIINREIALGRAAWCFAHANPAFGQAVFGRDITGESELAYSREFVERERVLVERLRASFLTLGELPPESIGTYAPQLLSLIYQQHLPLKRWCWRTGLLEAASSRPEVVS